MSSVDVSSTLSSMQSATAATKAEQKAASGTTKEIDQDSFLQLLIAQLQNQDPMSPMDNSQFLSQTAQFTQVSEMQKLNQSNSFAQASDLIGKVVTLNDANNNNSEVTGTVTEARITDDSTSVVIDGKEYSTKYIKSVKDQTSTSTTSSSTGTTADSSSTSAATSS
jgi:flagellar basal-body rod modification protein FlgD